MRQLIIFILTLFCLNTLAQDGPWTQKAPIPAEGRHRTSGWSIGNKGYIGLGHYNSGPNGNIAKADIWEYDLASDSWTQKADYGSGATYGAAAFTIGNKAYVGAHVYNSSEFLVFDPILNTWTAISPCPGSQTDMTAFAINEKGYAVSSSAIYEYDPIADAWTLKVFTPSSFYSWTKSFTIGEKAYILSSAGFYEYKPANNQFVPRASFPGEAVGGWSTFGTETKGYVVTGYINYLSPTSRQTWEFDPDLNSWKQLEELPGSTRRFSSSFVIGGKGYIGTGTNGINLKDFWEFDPSKVLEIEDATKMDQVNVFPNPSTDRISIQFNNQNVDGFKLSLYTLSGKLIFDQFIVDNSIDLYKSEIGAGLFLYEISIDSKTIQTGKLIFD